MISKKLKSFIATATALFVISTSISANALSNVEENIKASSNNAYSWLKAQQNITADSKLVDSFEDNFPVSYTYDQACAVIAFVLKGDLDRAKTILNTLEALQTPQSNGDIKNRGAWCNSYYNNSNNFYGEELRLHVGVAMWVCMAVMAYEKATGDLSSYHEMAINAIDWALLFQQPNGGIAGGRTTWDLPGITWSDEVWSSTEHNEDVYAVLNYFSKNTPSKTYKYNTAAVKIKNFLDTVVWDEQHQRFYGGFKNNTSLVDPFVPMDANPWGVLSLGTNGVHKYSNSIYYIENANGNPGTLNNPRYKQTVSYNGDTITCYDFDWQDDGIDGRGKDIWFEGSAFMANAYYLIGNTNKGNEILTEIMKKQSKGYDSTLGGIPYSLYGTHNNYWKMASANSVSSTAWFIIAAEKYNPFTASYIGETPNHNTPIPTPEPVPTPTPDPTPEPTPGESNYGIKLNRNEGTIYFKPKSNIAWSDVHYSVNNGIQQNVRMTYNSSTNSYETKIAGKLNKGDIVKYSFTYFDSIGHDTEYYSFIVL